MKLKNVELKRITAEHELLGIKIKKLEKKINEEDLATQQVNDPIFEAVNFLRATSDFNYKFIWRYQHNNSFPASFIYGNKQTHDTVCTFDEFSACCLDLTRYANKDHGGYSSSKCRADEAKLHQAMKSAIEPKKQEADNLKMLNDTIKRQAQEILRLQLKRGDKAEAEWSHGDDCFYLDSEFTFLAMLANEFLEVDCVIQNKYTLGVSTANTLDLSKEKPETKFEQKRRLHHELAADIKSRIDAFFEYCAE